MSQSEASSLCLHQRYPIRRATTTNAPKPNMMVHAMREVPLFGPAMLFLSCVSREITSNGNEHLESWFSPVEDKATIEMDSYIRWDSFCSFYALSKYSSQPHRATCIKHIFVSEQAAAVCQVLHTTKTQTLTQLDHTGYPTLPKGIKSRDYRECQMWETGLEK